MAYRYNRINWQNKPNVATPISAENLNKMDKGIDDNDKAIGDLAQLNTSNKSNLVSAVNELNNNLPLQIGNWTPTLVGNHIYSAQTGKYVKVGRLVYITGGVSISQKDPSLPSSTHIYIAGLPFPASHPQVLNASFANIALKPNSIGISFRTSSNWAIYGYNLFNNANISIFDPSQLTDATDIFISGCYLTEQ